MTFTFAADSVEHLESRDIFNVHRPKTLNALVVRGYEIMTKWIHYLYSNVVDRLFVATNQSMNDRREQTLRLDSSQLILI